MSDLKLFHQSIVLNMAKSRCKSAQGVISPNQYQILVYKSKIWPKIHLPPTKSDCIGFRITSGIPVVSYVSYMIQESENTASDGCIRKC